MAVWIVGGGVVAAWGLSVVMGGGVIVLGVVGGSDGELEWWW